MGKVDEELEEEYEDEELEEEYEDDEYEEDDRATKVEKYIKRNRSKLDKKLSVVLAEKLLTVSDEKFNDVEYYYLKSPSKMRLTSIFLGWLGIDRFLMGDIGIGTLKFFTLGCGGVLWLIDIFKLPKKIKEENVGAIFLDILDK